MSSPDSPQKGSVIFFGSHPIRATYVFVFLASLYPCLANAVRPLVLARFGGSLFALDNPHSNVMTKRQRRIVLDWSSR